MPKQGLPGGGRSGERWRQAASWVPSSSAYLMGRGQPVVFVAESVAGLLRLLEVLFRLAKGRLRFQERDSLVGWDLGEFILDVVDGGGHADELSFGGLKLADSCVGAGEFGQAGL